MPLLPRLTGRVLKGSLTLLYLIRCCSVKQKSAIRGEKRLHARLNMYSQLSHPPRSAHPRGPSSSGDTLPNPHAERERAEWDQISFCIIICSFLKTVMVVCRVDCIVWFLFSLWTLAIGNSLRKRYTRLKLSPNDQIERAKIGWSGDGNNGASTWWNSSSGGANDEFGWKRCNAPL